VRVHCVMEDTGADKAQLVSITDSHKLRWWRQGSMQNLLTDYMRDPWLAHGLAPIATHFDMVAVDLALEAGADAIMVPGDLAGECTTIMSPRNCRQQIKPYH